MASTKPPPNTVSKGMFGAWRQSMRAPGVTHRVFGTGLGAAMWFFLMYRAKQDGAVLMGWKHPWDH